MAGEVINLATFNLDTQAMVKNLSELQDAYFDLRKEQKSYTDQTKDVQKEIDKLTKKNAELSGSEEDKSNEISANIKQIESLTAKQKELYKSEQNLGIQMATVRKEINLTTTQVKAYQDAEGKTKSLIDLGNEALGKQIKNKNEARAANIALNNVANQLNPNIEEENALLIKLNAQMDKNTQFIKDNSSETAKQKMNIGNYSSALEGLDGILAKFGVSGQDARDVILGFTNTVTKASSDLVDYTGSVVNAVKEMVAFRTAEEVAARATATQTAAAEAQAAANVALATTTAATTTATTASTLGLKAFTVALASTGIGLIIIGLGALFSYLKDLDPLLDKIEQGFAAVGAVVRVLGSAIANLSFDGLGKSMSRAADEAIKLKEAQQDLADLQNSQEVANAKASQQYDELILKSKNRTLTEKERIAFLQKAEKIEEANYEQRSNLATAELNQAIKNAQIKGQLSNQELQNLQKNTLAYGTYLLNAGKITEADLEQLKKAELGKIAIDAESTKRLEKNQNAQDKLFEDAKTKREKETQDRKAATDKQKQLEQEAIDRALSKSKAEIDLFIAEQGFKRKSAEEEHAFNYELYNKEYADLKLQLQKKKITQAEFDSQMQQLRVDYLAKNAELTIANAELEINAQIEKNNRILENDKFLSDEQLKIKQEALNNQLIAEENYQAILLEQGKINQAEYDLAIAQVKAESKSRADELIEANKAAEQEKALIDLENQKIINEENFIAQAEIEKAQNEIKRQQEVADADKTGADISLINAKYAKIQEDIDKAVLNEKLSATADIFGGIAQILGENSKAGKAAAILAIKSISACLSSLVKFFSPFMDCCIFNLLNSKSKIRLSACPFFSVIAIIASAAFPLSAKDFEVSLDINNCSSNASLIAT